MLDTILMVAVGVVIGWVIPFDLKGKIAGLFGK